MPNTFTKEQQDAILKAAEKLNAAFTDFGIICVANSATPADAIAMFFTYVEKEEHRFMECVKEAMRKAM